MFPESFPGVDGVVVGERNDGHPTLLQPGVDFCGLVVRLAANPAEDGSVAHARGDRVNVGVAAHETIVDPRYEQAMKRSLIVDECVHGTP